MSTPSASRCPAILLAGSFGFGNSGDDAILAAMIEDLRALRRDVVLRVAAGDPAVVHAAHGVEAIHWHDVPALLAAAQASDLIALGGGGLFYDYWGFDPSSLLTMHHTELAYYTGFAVMAALLDKPLMVYAAGVGPLHSEAGRAFTALAFEQADIATVRDAASQALVAGLDVGECHVQVTADPAFGFHAAPAVEAEAVVHEAAGGPVQRRRIGIVLRPWDVGVVPQAWEAAVASALDSLLDREDAVPVFVPFQSVPGILTDDAAVARHVAAQMRHGDRALHVAQSTPPAVKAAVLATCDVVLAMRLHGVLFAANAGVPAVALAYDPKVEGVAGSLVPGVAVTALPGLDAARLAGLLKLALDEREARRAALRSQVPALAGRARENARLAIDLLEGRLPRRRALGPRMLAQIKAVPIAHARRLHDLERTVRDLHAHAQRLFDASEAQRAMLEGQTASVEAQLAQARAQADALSLQLRHIAGSRAWALAQRLSSVRRRLLPEGTRRQRLLLRAREAPSAPAAPAPGPAPPAPPAPTPAETLLAEALAASRADPVVAAPTRARGRRVAILTNRILDWATRAPCYGGGERYCLTLAALLRDLGFEVTLFQVANAPFEAEHAGFRIVALPPAPGFSEFQSGVCDAFTAATRDFAHVVHNLPEYASGEVRPDAIVVCHGIWFDHDNYGDKVAFRTPEWFRHLHRVFAQPARVVSVDTNSINVVRTLWPGVDARMTYLPNWVDTTRFRPPAQEPDSRIVLFPRRSQVNRGSRLMADLLAAVPHDWRFRWVGEGDAEDTQRLQALAARDQRLEVLAATFDEMPGHYRESQIVVIPTLAAEGTSLACLEALACARPVVATHVGGLGNLIQPGLNGLLVDPRADALAAAVNALIEQPMERKRLGEAGRATAAGFDLTVWRRRWIALLADLGWIGAEEARAHA